MQRTIILFSISCALLLANTAMAQQVALPNIGTRHLMMGITSQPSLIFGDETPGSVQTAPAHAQMIHLGVMQLLNRQFAMSAGLDFGAQWMTEHGASTTGRADALTTYAISAGLRGHWIPSNTLDGLMISGGLEYFRAAVDEAPAQIMSLNALVGWLLWTKSNQMAIAELGYHFPLIQGLSLPTDFSANTGGELKPVAEWSWHRVSLTIRWSF